MGRERSLGAGVGNTQEEKSGLTFGFANPETSQLPKFQMFFQRLPVWGGLGTRAPSKPAWPLFPALHMEGSDS